MTAEATSETAATNSNSAEGSFAGLTTSPSFAVVDTAAQDGLIGSRALDRLKQELAMRGLKCVWTGKHAKARGVGGAAKVKGIVAIPIGVANTTGILEATVVEGEVPLLLPIKMLKQLRAVIDLDHSLLHFAELGRSIPLSFLPSGHVAIDVLQFGESGFSFPSAAAGASYRECDFMLNSGSSAQSPDMLNAQQVFSVFRVPSNNGSAGIVSPCLQPWRTRCEDGGCVAKGPQFEDGAAQLALCARQGMPGRASGLVRGVGELVAATGCGWSRDGLFSSILRAARRSRQSRQPSGTFEEQDQAQPRSGLVSTCQGEVESWSKPTFDLGPVRGLSLPLECTKDNCKEGKEDGGQAVEQGGDVFQQCGHSPEGTGGLDSPSQGGDWQQGVGDSEATPRTEHQGQNAERTEQRCAGTSLEGAAARTDQEPGDSGAHEIGVCSDGAWRELHDEPGLPRRSDVHLRGATVGATGRSQAMRVSACRDPQREDEERDGPGAAEEPGCAEQPGSASVEQQQLSTELVEGSEEGSKGQGERPQCPSKPTTWIRMKGSSGLREKVQRLRSSGHYVVTDVLAVVNDEAFQVEDDKVLDFEDECMVGVQPSDRAVCEDLIEECEETALPKKVKKKLRAASKMSEAVALPVAVSEVYSPPRITACAKQRRLVSGKAYDLLTGYNWKEK